MVEAPGYVFENSWLIGSSQIQVLKIECVCTGHCGLMISSHSVISGNIGDMNRYVSIPAALSCRNASIRFAAIGARGSVCLLKEVFSEFIDNQTRKFFMFFRISISRVTESDFVSISIFASEFCSCFSMLRVTPYFLS